MLTFITALIDGLLTRLSVPSPGPDLECGADDLGAGGGPQLLLTAPLSHAWAALVLESGLFMSASPPRPPALGATPISGVVRVGGVSFAVRRGYDDGSRSAAQALSRSAPFRILCWGGLGHLARPLFLSTRQERLQDSPHRLAETPCVK